MAQVQSSKCGNTKQNRKACLPYLLFRFRGGFSTVPVSLRTKQIRWSLQSHTQGHVAGRLCRSRTPVPPPALTAPKPTPDLPNACAASPTEQDQAVPGLTVPLTSARSKPALPPDLTPSSALICHSPAPPNHPAPPTSSLSASSPHKPLWSPVGRAHPLASLHPPPGPAPRGPAPPAFLGPSTGRAPSLTPRRPLPPMPLPPRGCDRRPVSFPAPRQPPNAANPSKRNPPPRLSLHPECFMAPGCCPGARSRPQPQPRLPPSSRPTWWPGDSAAAEAAGLL